MAARGGARMRLAICKHSALRRCAISFWGTSCAARILSILSIPCTARGRWALPLERYGYGFGPCLLNRRVQTPADASCRGRACEGAACVPRRAARRLVCRARTPDARVGGSLRPAVPPARRENRGRGETAEKSERFRRFTVVDAARFLQTRVNCDDTVTLVA